MTTANYLRVLFWLAIAGIILPWIWMTAPQAINADNLWCIDGLIDWLSGEKMTTAFYGANPPLVIFLYTIPVLIYKVLGAPLHYAVFGYGVALVAFWSTVLYTVLRRWEFLDQDRVAVILLAFIAANTVLTTTLFCERDQMIGMALMPFVLIQLAITFEWPCDKRMAKVVLFFAALFILIKPHHLVLPGILILHRMIRRRQIFAVLRDPDFLSLAIAAIIHVTLTLVLFPDFVTDVLPESIRFYATAGWNVNNIAGMTAGYAATGSILLGLAFLLKNETKERTIFTALVFAGMLSVIPYVAQGRGYYYHLIPANIFIFTAFSFWIFCWIRRQTSKSLLAFALTSAVVAYLPWTIIAKYRIPTHAEYRRLPLVRMVNSCADKPCRFFMFSRNMEVPFKIAYYSGSRYSSRFPTFWFLPRLLIEQDRIDRGLPSKMTAAEIAAYRVKYEELTAKDLARYKPQVALIGSFRVVPGTVVPFDFVKWFSADPAFAHEWAHYKKTGMASAAYDDYLPEATHDGGPVMTFDVWERVR